MGPKVTVPTAYRGGRHRKRPSDHIMEWDGSSRRVRVSDAHATSVCPGALGGTRFRAAQRKGAFRAGMHNLNS
jgi:hypothetical protein